MAVSTSAFLTLGDGSDTLVEVTVLDGITLPDVAKVDQQWEGPMDDLVVHMTLKGYPLDRVPPSWSWTWAEMLRDELPPESRVISIEHDGRCQGLMAVYLDARPCRHSVGADAIYLAYVGAAPWNMGYYLGLIGQKPIFDDVGLVLLALVAQKSVECGCEGRVIIHASKGSEGFYRKCGILETGPDSSHPANLLRFEITAEQARKLMG